MKHTQLGRVLAFWLVAGAPGWSIGAAGPVPGEDHGTTR